MSCADRQNLMEGRTAHKTYHLTITIISITIVIRGRNLDAVSGAEWTFWVYSDPTTGYTHAQCFL